MQNFIKVISVSAVVVAASFFILPNGKMQKSFKYAVGIFSLAVIVNSAVGIFGGFDAFFDKKASNINSMAVVISIEEASLKTTIESILKNNGINFEKVEITADICDDGSINIIKAEAKLDKSENFKKAVDVVFAETGLYLSEG